MRRLLLMCLCVAMVRVAIVSTADEHPLPAALSADFSVLEGTFVQEKTIAALPRPLRSEGRFMFEKNLKLSWHVTVPVSSQVDVFPDRIVEIVEGKATNVLDVDANPLGKALTDLFFGVLAGDLKRLEEHFHVVVDQQGSQWSVTLTPLDPRLASGISSIQLKGGSQIEDFVFQETRGDLLHIEFHNLTSR